MGHPGQGGRHVSSKGKGAQLKKTAIGVGNSSSNPHRRLSAAKLNGGTARTQAKINILNMYRGGKAIRNKKGEVVGGQYLMKTRAGGKEIDGSTGRVQPDRRWFGNTRVVGQAELDKFREEMSVKAADPYSVILRRKKLPMGLLVDAAKANADGGKSQLLEVESFEETFSANKRRKRPKIEAQSLEGMVAAASKKEGSYGTEGDTAMVKDEESLREGRKHDLFMKGQSKRIWSELYKVIDCSDVLLQVIDARNVPGTRCRHLETYLRKHAPHKHLVFVLNKCDLVPTWVTRKWVQHLSKTVPTLAFHASMGAPFGKGALINLLRQFSVLHGDKKAISVGVVGYPNVGKSSIINTLRAKKVCKTAPVPGETKIWQYISLMKRISLVDCPGIVYDTGDTETDTVLKGIVRSERLPDPTIFIGAILERSRKEHIQRTYGLADWTDEEDFMTQLAKRNGRLLAGGEPDFNTIAVGIINDWQRGKLPFYVAPPDEDDEEGASESAGASGAGGAEAITAEDEVAEEYLFGRRKGQKVKGAAEEDEEEDDEEEEEELEHEPLEDEDEDEGDSQGKSREAEEEGEELDSEDEGGFDLAPDDEGDGKFDLNPFAAVDSSGLDWDDL